MSFVQAERGGTSWLNSGSPGAPLQALLQGGALVTLVRARYMKVLFSSSSRQFESRLNPGLFIWARKKTTSSTEDALRWTCHLLELTSLQHHMDIRGRTSGLADWGNDSHFYEEGPECVFQLQKNHTATQSPTLVPHLPPIPLLRLCHVLATWTRLPSTPQLQNTCQRVTRARLCLTICSPAAVPVLTTCQKEVIVVYSVSYC